MQTVKHPTSVMIWSSMSAYRPDGLYILEKTMRQDQYFGVTKYNDSKSQRLVPGRSMHVRALSHQVKKIKEFLNAIEITLLPWPGNSLEMNPIENLWSIVKQKMKKENLLQKTGLIEPLINFGTTMLTYKIPLKTSEKHA